MPMLITRLRNHLFDSSRWAYLFRSMAGFIAGSRRNCPNCGCPQSVPIDRKILCTSLVRCSQCLLQFRAPTDPPTFGDEFYQEEYSQGFTTDCPSDDQLKSFVASSFVGTPKDFSGKLALLEQLQVPKGARILDFGASWGYGTWQFRHAGYDAVGFEPGRRRARYATEKLGVQVTHETDALKGPFDVIFSSHVLEHVPTPTATLRQMKSWLRPGGMMIAFVPNGSEQYRRTDEQGFSNHWGMVHPSYLDERYFSRALDKWSILMTGTPWDSDAVRSWDKNSNCSMKLDSWELLVIAVRARAKV
jgi:protein-L-isoaspartate O-methyltransferase